MVKSGYIGIDLGTMFTRVASTFSCARHEQGQVTMLECDLIKRQIPWWYIRSLTPRTVVSVRKNNVLVGGQVISNCDIENTAYYLKELVGKTEVDKEWKDRFGMQYSITRREDAKDPGLDVGFWFDNTHKELFSVEYVLKIIVDYCKDALENLPNSYKVTDMAISIPSYWEAVEMESYQRLISLIDVKDVTLVRDHVAIAYYYGCNEMFRVRESRTICFVNISYSYSFSMICTFQSGKCIIKSLVLSRTMCGKKIDRIFEDLLFEKLFPYHFTRNNFLGKPSSIFSVKKQIEGWKCDSGFRGVDECQVEMSKLDNQAMGSVIIHQKDYFQRVKNAFTPELKEMILKAKQESGVDDIYAVCVSGSAVRLSPVRDIIDEAAREMSTRTIDVLSVDDAVCQGLVYKMISCKEFDASVGYTVIDCETAVVMGEEKRIMTSVYPRMKRAKEEKFDKVMEEKKEIVDARKHRVQDCNRLLDEMRNYMDRELDEAHRQCVIHEYNRLYSITGTDSKKHFYPKGHYDFYYRMIEAFFERIKKWKECNYHGVIGIVPPTYEIAPTRKS